ncbi:uncharacterized protein LOC106167385 [Lingula anatina]|uniref:Uncharacterized protein LOC106167385 n=1 Tax=Lingula anatina TaxID=7574 RepID=A0A1S3ITU6_LINAN|nr:uncharacterized protein LOC106167385 [Lingula anatina]|eukprot:XP_013401622.1 uncharacterized protein LOC106167385 [Lingula anatina]
MTDEQIEEYVPTFGDRIAQSTLVGEQCEEGEETSTQSSQSKEEGILERLQEEFRQKFLKEKKSSRYESLHGNQNAKKNIRRIELGWLHKEWGKGFTQVKSQNGGGTRHLTIPCDMKMKDLKQVAMDLFFEHGQSGKG